MLWIDSKYANLACVHLELVKHKGNGVINFRCVFCGDSQKHKYKARGYLFPRDGYYFFHCHNCQTSHKLSSFLEFINPDLQKQYRLECFREMGNKSSPIIENEEEEKEEINENLADLLLDNCSSLPEEHEAIQYLNSRKIPKNKRGCFHYCDSVNEIENIREKYANKFNLNSSAVISLVRSRRTKNVVGLSARLLHSTNDIRYLVARINENESQIFNIENVNFSKTIYVFEGVFDSVFCDNSVAMLNSNLTLFSEHSTNCVLVFDNQPKNKEIVKLMGKAQRKDMSVCVWPEIFDEKDLNDMILSGRLRTKDVMSTINKNTYSGLSLLAKISEWRKC